MTPSWITDNYKVWLRGDDVDMQEVRFFSLKTCVLSWERNSAEREALPPPYILWGYSMPIWYHRDHTPDADQQVAYRTGRNLPQESRAAGQSYPPSMLWRRRDGQDAIRGKIQ